MSSKIPVVRQIAWISLVPHLAVMGLLILIWYPLDKESYIIWGALTYIFVSQLLRKIIARAHQVGISKVKQEEFREAIVHFQKSYDFFKKNEWIDRYRYWTMLASTEMSYREMALNNIAFCHAQLGDGATSKAFYERTLEEFPNSGIAKTGLKMLNSMNQEEE